MPTLRALLVDRDGVINRNRPEHVLCWDDFVFLPGVLQAFKMIHQSGCAVAIVTNQAAINRGLCSHTDVEQLHCQMLDVIAQSGGGHPRVYYCPHRPDEGCDCRKPAPGMLHNACADMGVPPTETCFIGDSLTDLEAASSCGAQAALVLTGRGMSESSRALHQDRTHFLLASSLYVAVDRLLRPSALGRK
jgi:D-glycero-D-manno-heptose 1,7-bisphosphate phosphatase